MSNCPHRWVGHADGVTCELCDMSLTQKEYAELLNGSLNCEAPDSSAEDEPVKEETVVKTPVRRGKPATRRTRK